MPNQQTTESLARIKQIAEFIAKKMNNGKELSEPLSRLISSKISAIELQNSKQSDPTIRLANGIKIAFGEEIPLELQSDTDVSGSKILSFNINTKNNNLTEEQKKLIEKIESLTQDMTFEPIDYRGDLMLNTEILRPEEIKNAEHDIGAIIGASSWNAILNEEQLNLQKEQKNKKNNKIIAISGLAFFSISLATAGAITLLLPLSLPIVLGIGGGAALASGIMAASGFYEFKKSDNKIKNMSENINKMTNHENNMAKSNDESTIKKTPITETERHLNTDHQTTLDNVSIEKSVKETTQRPTK